MTARRGSVDGICFAAEGMAGTAAAASLRRLRSLSEAAPAGRLFAAISTLTEMSGKAATSLEEGSRALAAGDEEVATVKLARAIATMDDLAQDVKGKAKHKPSFLRRKR